MICQQPLRDRLRRGAELEGEEAGTVISTHLPMRVPDEGFERDRQRESWRRRGGGG